MERDRRQWFTPILVFLPLFGFTLGARKGETADRHTNVGMAAQ